MEQKKDYDFYLIFCNDGDKILTYVGSTNNIKKRMSQHKSACNSPNNKHYDKHTYKTINDNGGWDNFSYKIIGKSNDMTKAEALFAEQGLMNLFKPTINQSNAFTNDEYKKKQMSENKKQYYQKNKEEITTARVEYRKQNKEKILKHMKEYNEEHKEQKKEYRENYKERRKLLGSEKINCECGCVITKQSLAKHIKSKNHISYINKN